MGKLYNLGDHRLVCGDCRKRDDIDLLLEGEKADLCVTSPPYNQALNKRLESIKKKTSGGMYKKNKSFLLKMGTAYNDVMPEDDYQREQIDIIDSIYDRLSDTGALFYNHKIRYRKKKAIHPMVWLSKTQFILRQEIIWNKSRTIVQSARMFLPTDERIYWLVKGPQFCFNEAKVKKYTTVWPITERSHVKGDCLPFPNKIPYRCIIACSKENDIVFDPYAGTGTTLIVAEMTGRKARCIEIDPKRTKSIITRWEKLMKDQAANEGESRQLPSG